MSRSISYRKGTSSGFSTAINVRCRNEKINVSVSIHLDGLISITPYVFYMYLPIFIFQRIWSFSSFKCVSPIVITLNIINDCLAPSVLLEKGCLCPLRLILCAWKAFLYLPSHQARQRYRIRNYPHCRDPGRFLEG